MASNIPDDTQSNDDSLSSESSTSRTIEDKIYEELKKAYFIDVNCQEMLDLRGAVEKYLTKLSEANAFQRLPFRIEKLVQGGSMAENTRLWQCDRVIQNPPSDASEPDYFVEFDYLAIMSGNEMGFVNQEYCPGFIQVLNKNKTKQLKTLETNLVHDKNFVDVYSLALIFRLTVFDIIDKWDTQGHSLSSKAGTHEILETPTLSHDPSYWKEVLNNEFLRASQRIIDTKSGSLLHLRVGGTKFDSRLSSSHFKFVWVRKVQHQESSNNSGGFADCAFKVDVDFLPAYEFECDSFQEEHAHVFKSIENFNRQNQMSEGPLHVRYIVPKRCHKEKHRFCWKVSTMLLEQALIKRSSEIHLDSYKLLKFFILDSRFGSIITSYMLKTVFLLHLKECASSEGSVKGCLHAMLHSLSKMCMDGCIPHFFYDSHNLLTKRIKLCRICQNPCKLLEGVAIIITEIQLLLTNADSVFKDGWTLETLSTELNDMYRRRIERNQGTVDKTRVDAK